MERDDTLAARSLVVVVFVLVVEVRAIVLTLFIFGELRIGNESEKQRQGRMQSRSKAVAVAAVARRGGSLTHLQNLKLPWLRAERVPEFGQDLDGGGVVHREHADLAVSELATK